MKTKATDQCPICYQTMKEDKSNPLYQTRSPSGNASPTFLIFICCAPLASNPLHYYTHTVRSSSPSEILSQEFSVDLGTRYVLFRNDYVEDRSTIKSNKDVKALDIPILLIPDFPSLESLKRKIRTSITFS